MECLSVYKIAVSTEEKKLESMNRNERQKLLLEKKKLNLENLRLERHKLKEDKEEEVMILSMDLSKCNPCQYLLLLGFIVRAEKRVTFTEIHA